MPQGTVKWFSSDKGYGFIKPDDGSEDVFVHHTRIAGSGFETLEEGAKASYEVTRARIARRLQTSPQSKELSA